MFNGSPERVFVFVVTWVVAMLPLLKTSFFFIHILFDEQMYQESWSYAMFGFCKADFLSSLAYESAEQEPKHYLTPGFLIPLLMKSLYVLCYI